MSAIIKSAKLKSSIRDQSRDLVENPLHVHAMASELISAVESFTIDSIIRGYHVYKDVWSSFIGEMLYCRRDVRNHHDPFAAVAVYKGTTVVGHVPILKISAASYVFLGKAGATVTGTVTGSRSNT